MMLGRRSFWRDLNGFHSTFLDYPWVVLGNLNYKLIPFDQKGEVSFTFDMEDLNAFPLSNRLMDVELKNGKFT